MSGSGNPDQYTIDTGELTLDFSNLSILQRQMIASAILSDMVNELTIDSTTSTQTIVEPSTSTAVPPAERFQYEQAILRQLIDPERADQLTAIAREIVTEERSLASATTAELDNNHAGPAYEHPPFSALLEDEPSPTTSTTAGTTFSPLNEIRELVGDEDALRALGPVSDEHADDQDSPVNGMAGASTSTEGHTATGVAGSPDGFTPCPLHQHHCKSNIDGYKIFGPGTAFENDTGLVNGHVYICHLVSEKTQNEYAEYETLVPVGELCQGTSEAPMPPDGHRSAELRIAMGSHGIIKELMKDNSHIVYLRVQCWKTEPFKKSARILSYGKFSLRVRCAHEIGQKLRLVKK